MPKRLIKLGALVLQPLVEPDRNKQKATFKAMLKAKSPSYMKNSVGMIMSWDRRFNTKELIHIHGDKDHTLPLRNIKMVNYLIKGGSHMITLTRANEINKILAEVLNFNN
jgi:hypothetical protein